MLFGNCEVCCDLSLVGGVHERDFMALLSYSLLGSFKFLSLSLALLEK